MLARVKAHLLVDEVYLECLFRAQARVVRPRGAERADDQQPDEGLRARRSARRLDPRTAGASIARAQRISDLMTNNSVAAGERMALAAFRRLRDIDRRAHAILDPNLARVRAFFAREPRLRVVLPEGGNVVFPRLPSAIDGDRLVRHLVKSGVDAGRSGPVLRGAAPHPAQFRLQPVAARARPGEPVACARRSVVSSAKNGRLPSSDR